jgi:hypothetical protein
MNERWWILNTSSIAGLGVGAFFGRAGLKAIYVARAESHLLADEFVQTYGYWMGGKGCAIGCLAHSNASAHEHLERQINFPESLNWTADAIFEGFARKDKGLWSNWPIRFVSAPRPGADLSRVHNRFVAWALREVIRFDRESHPEIAAVVDEAVSLHERTARGDAPTAKEWSKVYNESYRHVFPAYPSSVRLACIATGDAASCNILPSSAGGVVRYSLGSTDPGVFDSPIVAEACARMADKLEELMKAV